MTSDRRTDLLIIGAGPFGLSLAAYARHLGLEHSLVGKPMGFWQDNMPQGMFLRSACDWHLDPLNVDTIEDYLKTLALTPADVEPLSLSFYLGYARWFQERKQLQPLPGLVRRLDSVSQGAAPFVATLDDGGTISAQNVVIAPGFRHFKHQPEELTALLPAGRFAHTCDLTDFTGLAGQRCLIIGGRQSAYEWAALIHEAGAAAVHISHRHASPAFAAADWSWVTPLVDAMVANPGWFRNLPQAEQEAVKHRLWAEGRLKVEPWLAERVLRDSVSLWPQTQVVGCQEAADGALTITFDRGAQIQVDRIVLATGYRVNLAELPLLAAGNLLARLAIDKGFPVLDEHFQTSVPGLYVTSMPATQDFGPFFAFTVSVRTSARLIGDDIRRKQAAADLAVG